MISSDTSVNILKFFMSSGSEVILIIDDLKVRAQITRIDDFYLYIKSSIPLEIPKLPYGMSCIVPYGKDVFFFNSEIVRIENSEFFCVIPSSVIKKHHREYERYNVEGILFASLNIVKEMDDKEFINRFPLSMRNLFDKGLQNTTYEEVLEKAIDILSKDFGEVMYIDEFSQLEWLKYPRYNKVGLLVSNINSRSFLEPFRMYGFASYGYFIEPSKRNLFDAEVKTFVNYHVTKGFNSYIYLPMFLVDNLLGYLMICSNEIINVSNYNHLSKLMRILGMVDLVEQFFCYNRFFVLNEHRDYPIPIIDISFGGMKIKIDKHIAYFVNVNDTVKVYFRIGARFFEIIGEIIRIGYENNDFVSAIKFVNMNKEDFGYIRKWFSSFKRW
ncbi:MAG: PilZ domain-containing protein [Brevinematales bacterium]|nr:PilZ domain-containing protein [Brevinematales bacterium]